MTNPLFSALHDRRAFILYALVARDDGKLDKVPVNPLTGRAVNSQDPAAWMLPAEVQTYVSLRNLEPLPLVLDGVLVKVLHYGPGIVIAKDSGLAFVDFDKCSDGNGGWLPHVAGFEAWFPGAYTETSISRGGRHIVCSYTGEPPAHGTRNKAYHMECYTEARFMAIGDIDAQGSPLVDSTPALFKLLIEFFPASASGNTAEWTTEPVPEWRGPTNDDELLRRALRATGSLARVFNGHAQFRDLHEDGPATVEKHYAGNDSSADQGYFNHLAFWTGKDCERMLRIAQRPDCTLHREKWDNRDDYLPRTILTACAGTKNVYQDPAQPQVAQSPGADVTPLPPQMARIDRTDVGNASLLIQQTGGNLRYVAETKQWLRWSGNRWQIDEHQTFVNMHAVSVAEFYLAEAQRLEKTGRSDLSETAFNWHVKCRSKKYLDAMLSLARKVPGVPISVNDLDRNPWLLGVDNGVVDLRTGELHETEAREDYVTKRCAVAYNPEARAPRWEAAVDEITGLPIEAERDDQGEVIAATVGRFTARPALARYVQKMLGYCLTGTTREQKFFLLIGEGSNGKGVIFDTVIDLLGPYAMPIPSEMFIATKHAADSERPTAFAASLAGVRLVVSSETKEGQQLDMAVVKSHTGDRKLTARKMRSDPITFDITHKPCLLTNAQPKIDHLDPATRGRIHTIPFDRRWNRPGEVEPDPALPDGDKTLMAHLLTAEREGILAWAVRGALLYQQEGLNAPAEVAARTHEYLLEQDHLGRWINTATERCPPRSGTLASDLFQQFGQFCMAESVRPSPSTQKAFSTALARRGVAKQTTERGAMYGLRVISAPSGGIFAAVGFGHATLPPDAIPPPPGSA